MNCVACGGTTTVYDSRPTQAGGQVKRRRRCLTCDHRFTSIEFPLKFQADPDAYIGAADMAVKIFAQVYMSLDAWNRTVLLSVVRRFGDLPIQPVDGDDEELD